MTTFESQKQKLYMPNPYFSFKKFTIYHNLCAMKVGTDGVLLGAWADVSSSKNVLDIGTGSGLIAIMIAQRCLAQISAIDIDKNAAIQAKINAEASPWKDRIEVLHTDLCNYAPQTLFDTIVSNPPYFIDSLKCPDTQRNKARHTDSLTSTQLLKNVNRILHPNGLFSLILPSDQTDNLIEMANEYGLFPTRLTHVITKPGLSPKRSLLEFRKKTMPFHPQELVIELDRHIYSKEYIALTKDFYLKM